MSAPFEIGQIVFYVEKYLQTTYYTIFEGKVVSSNKDVAFILSQNRVVEQSIDKLYDTKLKALLTIPTGETLVDFTANAIPPVACIEKNRLEETIKKEQI